MLALVLAACAGQKVPAQRLIADIEATITAASAEAAKYVPDQLSDVQGKLAALQAAYDKQDYAAVVGGAPAVLGAAQELATSAAAKKDEILKALNDQWTSLAAAVPEQMSAIQSRFELLSKKSSKKLARGIDLGAVQSDMDDANGLWSKAQAAFAAGNLDEAVATAKQVGAKAAAAAAAMHLDLTKS